MKKLLIALMCLPLLIHAQDQGIHFEQGLSWEQVKAKAKAENKYIFMDCYATWCGPCKAMDKEVYALEKVGNFLNDKFISVKVQMDTTQQDNEQVKKWYADVHSIQQQFKIPIFPTYLFFSSGGKIVHKGHSYKEVDDFISLADDALKPAKQYYTLLNSYVRGEKKYDLMYRLALMANDLGEKDVANKIAQDYLNDYLYKLKNGALYTNENIEFIRIFTRASKEKGFKIFFRYGSMIDSVMKKDGFEDYSQTFICYVILKEEVYSKLFQNLNVNNPITDKPNWDKMFFTIRKKYDRRYAEKVVLEGKLNWYRYKKEWTEYCNNVVKKVEKYGPYGYFDTYSKYNQNAWELFLHSNDKNELMKALAWSDSAIKNTSKQNEQYFDTYANLLYKLGRAKDAIEWQERAVKLDEENAAKSKRSPDKILIENLEKMRKGDQTWPKEQ